MIPFQKVSSLIKSTINIYFITILLIIAIHFIYMKSIIAVFILSILFSCKLKPKSKLINADQKGYTLGLDTLGGFEHDLIGRYKTFVLTDSNYYYLLLQKDTISRIISTTEAYHHINTLGWAEADFDSSFVLVRKFGGGFPGNPKP